MANLESPERLVRLPLIDAQNPWLPNATDKVTPLARDHGCQRCTLGTVAKHVCMGGIGDPGNVLVVGSSPTAKDDAAGRFMDDGGYNAIVRKEVAKWESKARFTWAVSCPAGRDPTPVQIAACRPFLAQEIIVARPPRVVLLGPVAAEGALGIPFKADRLRRAWAIVDGIPHFLVMHPQKAAYNGVYRKWFKEDLQWALTCPDPQVPSGEVRVLWEAKDARDWLLAVERHKPLVIDLEYWPGKEKIWAPGEFRILCAALCQDPTAPVVIPELTLAEVIPELRSVMEDPRVPKVNANIKSDRHALWRAYGVDMLGIEWDTMIVAGMIEAEAPRGLGPNSWLVGMGGYKDAGQQGADEDDE